MTPIPLTPETEGTAERVIWFEPAAKALRHPVRFLAYAMRYASYGDMRRLCAIVGDAGLREALATAPPGIIDPRSWWYWHAVLGVSPPPPMPVRRLPR